MTTGLDTADLRLCLGQFATGVTVVTTRLDDGEIHGATVNAFTAVSLAPPLVLVSLDRHAKLCAGLEGRPFAVNVLREDGREHALHFAGRPQDGLSFSWTDHAEAPHLTDATAWFVCAPWRSYDGGDHVLFLGEVEEFGFEQARPLLFHSGAFCSIGTALGPAPWLQSLDCPSSPGFLGADLLQMATR